MLNEMEQNSPFTADEFNKILDKEFSVFQEGEKYDYVKDMKNAYSKALEKTAVDKILETIPDHAFWDIKVSQQRDE